MKKRAVRFMVLFMVAGNSICMPLTAMALEEQATIAPEQTQEETVQLVKDEPLADIEKETVLSKQIASVVPHVDETQISPSPVLPEESPLALPNLLINQVMAGKSGQSSYEYIELYNPNPYEVFLDSWQVLLLRKDGSDTKQLFSLNGTVKPNGHICLLESIPIWTHLNPTFA